MNQENVKLYLPESFEWIILKSGLIGGKEIQAILEEPEGILTAGSFLAGKGTLPGFWWTKQNNLI